MLSIIYPTEVAFSSQFRTLPVMSEQKSVNVIFNINGIEVMNEVYYPFEGEVTVYGIDSLIEEFMESSGAPFARVNIRVNDGKESINVNSFIVYCRDTPFGSAAELDTSQWLSQNFLTLHPYRRIHPKIPMRPFLYIDSDNTSLSYFISVRGINLSSQSEFIFDYELSTSIVAGKNCLCLDLDYDDILRRTAVYEGVDSDSITISSVSVTAGDRFISYFFDDSLADAKLFYFFNVFNVPDFVAFPGQSVAVSSVSTDSATVLGNIVQYNRKREQSFKITWPALTVDDAVLAAELLSSHTVRIYSLPDSEYDNISFSALKPNDIVITDYKCEIEEFDELASVEFTYSPVEPHFTNPALNIRGRIFTDPYNFSFN